MQIPPGHVIYFSGTNLVSPDGKLTNLWSKSVKVSNVSEGPHTYSNIHSLGTLAVKYIDGGTFDHVNSQHPVGLIQSIVGVRNVTFSELNWSTDSGACSESVEACGVPVIEAVQGKQGEADIENVHFTNVSIKSTHDTVTTNLNGKGIEIDGLTIETPPFFKKNRNQGARSAALNLRDAAGADVKNYVYVPLLSSVDPGAAYNQPFACWGACTNVKVDVTVKWPKGVAMPATGHPALKSGIQFDKPGTNNTITSRTEVGK